MLGNFKWLITEFHFVIHKSLIINPFLMEEKTSPEIIHKTVTVNQKFTLVLYFN